MLHAILTLAIPAALALAGCSRDRDGGDTANRPAPPADPRPSEEGEGILGYLTCTVPDGIPAESDADVRFSCRALDHTTGTPVDLKALAASCAVTDAAGTPTTGSSVDVGTEAVSVVVARAQIATALLRCGTAAGDTVKEVALSDILREVYDSLFRKPCDPPAPVKPLTRRILAVGNGVKQYGPGLRLLDANGAPSGEVLRLLPEGAEAEVRVAVADVDGDGEPDVVAALGNGVEPVVKVFAGGNPAAVLCELKPLPEGTGDALFVAAGDLDCDGRAEIVVSRDVMVPATAAARGVDASEIQVFDCPAEGAAPKTRFRAFGHPSVVGIPVAVADVNGDGRGEIVTGILGVEPTVKVFTAEGVPMHNFLAFERGWDSGVHVAAGDLDGDGRAEIVVGKAASAPERQVGDPRVRVFAAEPFGMRMTADAAVFGPGTYGGAKVAVSQGEIVVATGVGKDFADPEPRHGKVKMLRADGTELRTLRPFAGTPWEAVGNLWIAGSR